LTNTGRHQAKRVARMNSGVPGFRGIVLLAPDEGVGAFVLANSSGAGEKVFDLGRRALDELIEARTGTEPPDYSDRVPDQVDWPAQATATTLKPMYATALGLVNFAPTDEHFVMRFLGYELHATKRKDGWYQLRYRLLGFMPLSLGIFNKVLVAPARFGDEDVLLAWFQGGRFLFGEALAPAPLDAASRAMLGRYRLVNPDGLAEELKVGDVDLAERDGVMVASYTIPGTLIDFDASVPLKPLGDGRWFVPGLGSNMGDVLEALPAESGAAWRFSGYRFARQLDED
jgi:hypothetical protein